MGEASKEVEVKALMSPFFQSPHLSHSSSKRELQKVRPASQRIVMNPKIEYS